MDRVDTIMIILLMVCFFLLGASSLRAYEYYSSNPKNTASEVSANCSSLNLFEASTCLKNELSKWYKYNVTNIENKLTAQQLETEGGVCWHYSDWYVDNMRALGYSAEKKTFLVNSTMNHAVAIASNEEGYCLLDQLNVACLKFTAK